MSINVLEASAGAPVEYPPGRRLGSYNLEKLLAQGGSGHIYLAKHWYLKTPAAVKVLHTNLDGEGQSRFYEEAQIAATFNHAHIVRVLDFGVESGTPFLVMEHAPHDTLRERYREGIPYSPSTILVHVQQVSSALQHIHERGYIHRDVKPDNMLVGREHQVLLSDFGISVAASPDDVLTNVSRVGTVSHMAPEQIKGKACPASDQYALAVMMYEWLSGTRLFQGTMREVARQHIDAEPKPLHTYVPGIAPAVEHAVLKALAKRPEDRFGSVQEFALAFREACEEGERAYDLMTETTEVDTEPLLLTVNGNGGASASLDALVDGKQTILKKSLRLLVCDLLIGTGVLMTLFGLHLPLFSFQLLLWLTLLSAPMIYTWCKKQWLFCTFTVISFAISALISLRFHEFVTLVSIYGFLLFVGFFIDWSLKLRSATQK